MIGSLPLPASCGSANENAPTKPPRGAFALLTFAPGEAFQFDWSEYWIRIGKKETKLRIAHFKLCHSRAFYLRA